MKANHDLAKRLIMCLTYAKPCLHRASGMFILINLIVYYVLNMKCCINQERHYFQLSGTSNLKLHSSGTYMG